MKRKKTHKSAGFSVVEVLVAVAIFAAAFMPLLALQSQLTQTAIATERLSESLGYRDAALAYLSTINPMRADQGDLDLGAAQLQWKASPVSDVRPIYLNGGDASDFSAQLFRVEATIILESGREDTFSVQKMGWTGGAIDSVN